MKIICLHCEKSFDGNNAKFCSQNCRNSHIINIEKRIREAIEDDPSHTRKMSDD